MTNRNSPKPAHAAWRDDLSRLAQRCADAPPAEQARCLRALHGLMAQAPLPAMLAGACLPAAATLEALLQAGAWESAVMALLGSDCGYMLSRGSEGAVLASVILPGRSEESSASGETAALAIAGALALALEDVPLPLGELADPVATPLMRLN